MGTAVDIGVGANVGASVRVGDVVGRGVGGTGVGDSDGGKTKSVGAEVGVVVARHDFSAPSES